MLKFALLTMLVRIRAIVMDGHFQTIRLAVVTTIIRMKIRVVGA